MNIEITEAKREEQPIIQNLARFYIYDLSEFQDRKCPDNGLFEDEDYRRYWAQPGHFPYVVKCQGELAGFYTEVEDQLVPMPIEDQPGRFYFVNAASSRYRGLELSMDQPLDDAFTAALSFSWGYYRFDDFTDADGNEFNNNHVPGIPGYQLFATLDYQPRAKLSTLLSARWTGKRYADNANTAKADGYVVVGIHGSYRTTLAGSQVRLYGGIDNLFDQEYDDNLRINAAGGRFFEPAPERSLFLGVSVTGRPGR